MNVQSLTIDEEHMMIPDTQEPAAKRHLGRTGIEITPIGLGVMQFAGGSGIFRLMFPSISQESMNDIIQAAIDGGINWFDTAEAYGGGRSEQGLANALKAAGQTDGDVIIATKWRPILRTAGNIRDSIADRQHHLSGYTIDLYQIHQPYSFSSPEAEMEAMAGLVEAGKIRSVGVSNFNAEQMRRAHAALAEQNLPLASNQVEYHLLNRQIESNGVLKTAKELGITIIAWSPLASGLLSGKFHQDPGLLRQTPIGRRFMLRRNIDRSRHLISALEDIAAVRDVTPAQVALNWLIHAQGETVVAIPGASKVQHAEQSAGTMKFRLGDEEIERIDQLSRQFR
jgi:aryl-alcohol dehydrogenase-like predicted oxidoreductase